MLIHTLNRCSRRTCAGCAYIKYQSRYRQLLLLVCFVVCCCVPCAAAVLQDARYMPGITSLQLLDQLPDRWVRGLAEQVHSGAADKPNSCSIMQACWQIGSYNKHSSWSSRRTCRGLAAEQPAAGNAQQQGMWRAANVSSSSCSLQLVWQCYMQQKLQRQQQQHQWHQQQLHAAGCNTTWAPYVLVPLHNVCYSASPVSLDLHAGVG